MKRTKNKIIIYIITILLLSILLSNNTFAESLDYNVIIDPTLNLSLSSSTVSLSLNPVSHTFASDNLNVSVSTNNPNGYKLYLTTNNNITSLSRINDGTPADSLNAVIDALPTSGSPNCTSGCTESNFPANHWGYKLTPATTTMPDTTKYYPYTPNTLINESNTTTNGISSTLTFGAAADYNKPAGTYELNLNFKALPIVTQYYMQDFDKSLCTEDPMLLIDQRDNRLYAVARLKDNKCWMLQNLRLGQDLEPVTGSMTLTYEDTNISPDDTINPRSTFTLTNQVVDGVIPNKQVSDPTWTGGVAYVWDASAFYCASDYGCYYNFYTVTAGVTSEGQGAVITNNTHITTDICPKGWKVPTGGGSSAQDFRTLANAYGYGVDPVATVSSRLTINPTSSAENINGNSMPGFTLAGHYYGNGSNPGLGNTGRYWSSTVKSIGIAYYFNIAADSVAPHYYSNKSDARPIRCLLQE